MVFFLHVLCDMEVDVPGYLVVRMPQAAGDYVKGNAVLCHEGYMGMPHKVRCDRLAE